MKATRTLNLLIISVAAVLFCSSFAPYSTAIYPTVTFGTPQSNGGVCVLRGVCKDYSGVSDDGIQVTVQVSPDNDNVLMITFLLSDLKSKQPDQAAYFTDPSGSYPFDVSFPLTDSIFSQLNLKPSPAILTTSASTVVINGDIVTDYITYYHL